MSCLLSLIRKSKTVIKNCRDAMLQDPVDLAIEHCRRKIRYFIVAVIEGAN